MSNKEKIQIFITGGTFDKSYDYINGVLYFKETHLPEMLKRSRCKLNIDFKTLVGSLKGSSFNFNENT